MTTPPVVTVTPGTSPVVLGFPHTGTYVPPDITARLNANGRLLADTDWHIHRLYDGLSPGASTVRALFHRYVIDANRDPSGASLYPGQNTTGLVPLTDFDDAPIWSDGGPDAAETARRLADFHAPYHAALAAELDRVRARHGYALLVDCHSIRSVIPFLFPGELPVVNVGTDMGRTCAPGIEAAVMAVLNAQDDYSHVLNGRFRGGWTTRHYGRPAENLHAVQIELAQSAYLAQEEPPFDQDAAKSGRLRALLARLLTAAAEAARHA